MKISEIKSALINKIDQTNDDVLIQYLYSLMFDGEFESKDYPSSIKLSIQKALDESKKGQIIPHAEVLKKYK